MALSYEKLINLLEKRNISLNTLQTATNLSSATISKLRKNDYVSLQTLEKIATYLAVTLDELITFHDEPQYSPLLLQLLNEKKHKIKGGIYHETQILLTYNSNHIEGSKLSVDETRAIFETNTIFPSSSETPIVVNDIIETINHFRATDYVLNNVFTPLNEELIKDLHYLLKRNTTDETLEWFNVGQYKKLPNVVGGMETTSPEDVTGEMQTLITMYEKNNQKTFNDIVRFHYNFKRIHPFQDGNGRVGRLIAFKELLRVGDVPFTIDSELKAFYNRGFAKYTSAPGYLIETCRAGQDKYKALLDYFRIPYAKA